MRQLIPENLNSRLDEIVTRCFYLNRITDRGMSVLAVSFSMHSTTELLHPKLAHAFPLLADKISTFQGERDMLTVYGETPLAEEEYESPLEFFEKMLDAVVDFEDLVSEVLNEARIENAPTYVLLEHFLRKIHPYVAQCLLLVDKAEQYSDWALFDDHIEKFIIL